MASSRTLSNDEVSALIDGLNNGSIDAGTGIEEKEYKPFKFGGEDVGLLGDFYTLRLINERFGRQLRNVLLPMLRFLPRITTLPPEIQKFDFYSAGLDTFLSLNTARVDELKSTILMTVPPKLISILVNTFFGGRGDSAITRPTEFTPTEERIIQIVVDGSLRVLEEAWSEILPVNFHHSSSETNPSFTTFVDGQEMVVRNSFIVQLPFSDPATIDILYPLQALKAIAPLMRSKIQRVGERDVNWERRLQNALLDLPLSFCPRIAEPIVTMTDLLNVKPGVVIEIPAFETVSVYVEGQSLFKGAVGERDGKMAVRIIK